MDPFEYATGLFAIVIGLAIGDMGMSLHKLLACRGVRWGYRPVAAAMLVAIVVSGMWFQLWSIRHVDIVRSYPFYASLIAELCLAFLTAAAVFPDQVGPDFDLVGHYEATARRLWTLFTLFQLSYLGHWIYFALNNPRRGWTDFAVDFAIGLIPVLSPAAMALWPRNAWLHRVLITALIGLFVLSYSGAGLN